MLVIVSNIHPPFFGGFCFFIVKKSRMGVKMGKVCTFFGHRDTVLFPDIYKKIHQTLIDLIENKGVDTFLSGGYSRFDDACSGMVWTLKKQYPHIQLHLILPYPTKKGASISPKETFCFENYDSVSYIDPDKLFFPKSAFERRNEYMVLQSDYMLCYVILAFGGAYKAMKKSLKLNKTVFNFAEKK